VNLAAFIFYTAFVTLVSLRPGSGGGIEHLDKVAHLIVYTLFAMLAYRVVKERRAFAYLCLGIIAYGGLMEVAQSFSPGRFMSGYDFLANTLGVVLGGVVVNRKWPYFLPKNRQ
jgi:VanZ family protein